MMTGELKSAPRPFWRSRWWMPAFSAFLGVLVFAAFAVGDRVGEGVRGAAVMLAVAALFAFGGRSETLRGLGGPGRDERWSAIDLRATAIAGMTTLLAILGAWLYEIADGGDGSPYGQLAALAGVSYVLAVAFLRWRG